MRVTNWYLKQPKWYSYDINIEHLTYLDRVEKYSQVVSWIYERIENPERHAQWVFIVDKISVKFRYEKNYLLFVLVWGDSGYGNNTK